ncbi:MULTISPECIES: hypothetical protein [Haloarcula]|uniref:hypothetical protein n=1 Tax=Haloarcula TaxID=2237 RepID=UPI0023EB5571|nr:hypothetical protein [Halomicroarcula sp. XH51]
MGTTDDDRTVHKRTELHTHHEHWTTFVLKERDDGGWLATQGGAAVEGHGETAAAAAAEYCQKISEAGDE